jgi:hypothetical protein
VAEDARPALRAVLLSIRRRDIPVHIALGHRYLVTGWPTQRLKVTPHEGATDSAGMENPLVA